VTLVAPPLLLGFGSRTRKRIAPTTLIRLNAGMANGARRRLNYSSNIGTSSLEDAESATLCSNEPESFRGKDINRYTKQAVALSSQAQHQIRKTSKIGTADPLCSRRKRRALALSSPQSLIANPCGGGDPSTVR